MGITLYIENLFGLITEAGLLELFRRIGPDETATIMTNTVSRLSKGIASVQMTNEMDAVTAISGLNVFQYDGRVISVSRDLRIKRNHP